MLTQNLIGLSEALGSNNSELEFQVNHNLLFGHRKFLY